MSEERCPTCGGPVTVAGDGMTHWYQPVTPPVIDVVRLNVQPGEVLAVRMPPYTTQAEVSRVKAWFEHHMPGVVVLAVSDGVTFAVISQGAT